MAETYYFEPKKKELSGWVYMLFLFLSFVWIVIYPVTNSLSYNFTLNFGNLFDASNPNASYIIFLVIFEALIGLIAFELVFYLYRFILSFKVYSFLVPPNRLKIESRVFFIYRNLIYGIFINLCFLYPFLYSYAGFIDILVSFVVLLVYAKHITARYSEPIVGHFVFKCFCYPFFVYEAIVLLLRVLGVV